MEIRAIRLLLCCVTSLSSLCLAQTVRLVNGTKASEGRVEVYYGGQWGTVCDDRWGHSDAKVVCRQLGYDTTAVVEYSGAYFGEGTVTISMTNVDCTGSEASLTNCAFSTTHSCDHSQDAGVACEAQTGGIRLVGGTQSWIGRVEVEVNGIWGTVCDDHWDDYDAMVVCRQLGYNETGATGNWMAAYGQGVGYIFLDNVNCVGNETSIWDCAANALADHNCGHDEDAGVDCGDQVLTTTAVTTTTCDNCNGNGTSNWWKKNYLYVAISASVGVPVLASISTVVIYKFYRYSSNSRPTLRRKNRVSVAPRQVRTVKTVPVHSRGLAFV